MELLTQSDLKPVSINFTGKGLTNGQILLLELLSESLKENKQVTRNDVIELYVKVFPRSIQPREWWSNYAKWDNVENKWVPGMCHETRDKDSWSIKRAAFTWFKRNLGACIIKGKLLAIPVIETI